MILMVMSVNNDFRVKGVQELHQSILPKGEARIDQEPIDKKGIDFVNWNT
jgi:hypothetical protein